ncbi:hypothetical protein Hte_003204 [Hypoxylon texense]
MPSSHKKSSSSHSSHKHSERKERIDRYAKDIDPLERFFVTGEPSGKSGEKKRRELDEWEARYQAASRR